jgi:prolyl-tRNA synthetase
MNGIGGQEITMPVLQPAELWQQSGRWEGIAEMFRLKDRYQRDMCLGMTHEEVIAWLAAKEIRSYRDLPQIWYQIQTKERDEARPRSGVLRTREFLMKDSYTLDPDPAALEVSYNAHKEAYYRIFDRCGIRYVVVESDPGMMGGSGSHEFMAPSAAGEDEVALCDHCGYSANIELARGVPTALTVRDLGQGEIATPNAKTIAELSALLGIDPAQTIKTLVFIAGSEVILALVRGDHALHERKLWRALRAEARPAHADEVKERLGVAPGSVGPVGARGVGRILADETLRDGRYVVGANRDGYHLAGVVPGRDFSCEFVDLQVVLPGEGCLKCGQPLRVERVIEIGNIFKLGTKYSVPLGALYLDEHGRERPVVMGSYGIGPARIAAAAIEQRHDPDGIVWPWAIAPVHVHVLVVQVKDPLQMAAAEELYSEVQKAGFDALLDDREERAGVKFKDADLLGAPIRVTVGNAFTKDGMVEIRDRAARSDRRAPRAEALDVIREMAANLSTS